MTRATAAVALALVLHAAGGLAFTVHSSDPPFSVNVPAGFARVDGVRPGTYAFGERDHGGATITLRALDGTIPNEPVAADDARRAVSEIEPRVHTSVESASAMDLSVPILVATNPDGSAVALATLPSMPRAIQLTVSAGDVRTVRSVTRAMMTSFRAPTNWLTPAQLSRKRRASTALAIGGALVIGYAATWLAFFRRRGLGALERGFLASTALAFAAAAAWLTFLPRGASPFDPIAPSIIAVVLGARAVLTRRAARDTPR